MKKWILSKRDIYFWFDRFGFGKREQTAVISLFTLLVLVEIGAELVPHFRESKEIDYSQLNELISQKTALLQAKHDSLMMFQYKPTEENLALLETQKAEKKKSSAAKKSSTTKAIPIISINEATISDWDKLPGIGLKTAELIVDYRLKNGSFSSIEDLKKIKGIGDKKLEQIKAYLKVD